MSDDPVLRVILAGTFQQAHDFVHKRGWPKQEYRIINRPFDVYGIHGPVDVYRVGTYWLDRPRDFIVQIENHLAYIEDASGRPVGGSQTTRRASTRCEMPDASGRSESSVTASDPLDRHTVNVENTATRDPLLHVAAAMVNPGIFITDMEKAGQGQLVSSDVMPSEAPWDDLIALGFVPGKLVDGDDLFRHCDLPAGWTKAATDHAMWSTVLDERGVDRVSVFYKAAFYDRRAFARLANPGYSAATNIIYGDEPVALPTYWPVLTDEERAQFRKAVDDMVANLERSPDVYQKYARRVTALRSLAGDSE